MLFLPLLLEEIFAMFEFAQTKLCYIKERKFELALSPVLNFLVDNNGKRGKNKTGIPLYSMKHECTTFYETYTCMYIGVDTCLIFIKDCVWLIFIDVLYIAYNVFL